VGGREGHPRSQPTPPRPPPERTASPYTSFSSHNPFFPPYFPPSYIVPSLNPPPDHPLPRLPQLFRFLYAPNPSSVPPLYQWSFAPPEPRFLPTPSFAHFSRPLPPFTNIDFSSLTPPLHSHPPALFTTYYSPFP